jgi:hypothetical protein
MEVHQYDDHTEETLRLVPSSESEHADYTRFIESYDLLDSADVFRKAAFLLQNEVRPEDGPNITKTELEALQAETDHKWSQPWSLYFTILMCSIGAVEQGMAQTSMNGANLYFPKEFGIDSHTSHDTVIVGLINSGIYLSVGIL